MNKTEINKTQTTILIDTTYEGQGTNEYPNLKEGSQTGTLSNVKDEIKFQPFLIWLFLRLKNLHQDGVTGANPKLKK